MTHTNTLTEPRVATTLAALFAHADRQERAPEPLVPAGFYEMEAREQAVAAADVYMPISPEAGDLLYNLVRAVRPRTVVEFGTSYGISTLYLAAAVRDNGAGHVITTELSGVKAAAARRTFAETGLDDVITLLEGDARETLAGVDAVDFLLLDGWKDLYVPVLRQLEPRLAPGTLVAADDTTFDEVRPYLDYVRDPANGYHSVSFPVADNMEISCRL